MQAGIVSDLIRKEGRKKGTGCPRWQIGKGRGVGQPQNILPNKNKTKVISNHPNLPYGKGGWGSFRN